MSVEQIDIARPPANIVNYVLQHKYPEQEKLHYKNRDADSIPADHTNVGANEVVLVALST